MWHFCALPAVWGKQWARSTSSKEASFSEHEDVSRSDFKIKQRVLTKYTYLIYIYLTSV